MKILVNCGEAAHVCDKAQYEEAGRWEKFLMKMHQLMCKLCREHSTQNTKLTKVINSAGIKTLSKDQKDALKAKLQREML